MSEKNIIYNSTELSLIYYFNEYDIVYNNTNNKIFKFHKLI
jgi:hypothetical protein